MTTSGCESIGTWLLATSVTFAFMRPETQRWRSGCTVWSCVARMYQLGFDFHANAIGGELLLVEQVDDGRKVRCPHELLVRRGEISGKELGAVWQHPGAPVLGLDPREDV
jgi:hypothetical protein